MYSYYFEKLILWKEAIDLTKSIYSSTTNFPYSEKYGAIARLRKASISICPDLAVGSTRITRKDKAHFTAIALSSTKEVLNLLIISKESGYTENSGYLFCRATINSIANKLNAL